MKERKKEQMENRNKEERGKKSGKEKNGGTLVILL